MALQVVKSSMDSISGHATLHVRVVERDQATGKLTYGPVVTEGIDHQSLTVRYGCPQNATPAEVDQAILRWLADRHGVLLGQKRALEQRGSAIHKMAGRTLVFGEADPAAIGGE